MIHALMVPMSTGNRPTNSSYVPVPPLYLQPHTRCICRSHVQCTINAPDGVPGDCFEISVRHAWPYISGGRDSLTTTCIEYPLDAPIII